MPMGIGPGLSVTRGGSVTGIGAIGADLALWFDENQAYKSSGGGIVTPDSILTYTAPSPKLVYGSDGVLGYAPHNLLLRSQEFDNASWAKTAGGTASIPVVTANAATAPDGTTTADRVQFALNGGTTTADLSSLRQTVTAAVGQVLTFWARSNDSNSYVIRVSDANGVATTITITPSWERFSASAPSGGGGAAPYGLVLRGGQTPTNSDTADILIWGAQLNLGSSVLTYIPTTTAAVYSLPRDYNPTTGAALGVLGEEARTNLCLYSDDFTNAAWVKSNLTAAKTATGPDGVANSASTLTATAANATALQAITSTSAARITSMFVKRRTGTGAVEMTQDNGSTWTAVTVTASWTRVSISSTTLTNPTVGVRIVTSGDAIDVALFQHELGAFITSPIPTVASQVTRAADQVSILTSAFPLGTSHTLVVSGDGASNQGARDLVGISDGSTTNRFLIRYENTNHLVVSAAGVTTAVLDGGTINSGEFATVAAAGATDDFAVSLNGGSVATDTSGAVPTTALTVLRVGWNVTGSVYLSGHIKRLAYYGTRKTDAELQVLSS